MTILLRNAAVFIGDGRTLKPAHVLVENDTITKVSEAPIEADPTWRELDLGGSTVMPGLIDCHIHVCLSGGADPTGEMGRDMTPTLTLKAAEAARRTLEAGYTLVRDMSGRNWIDLALRDAIRSGLVQGPRILAAGQAICMTGGHGWQLGGREADGPDSIRQAVREQTKAGVDHVKFMATGGVMTPGVEPGAAQLTLEELQAGVDEAHRAGRRTSAHAQGQQGIDNALKAGIDSIEHGINISPESLDFMANSGVALVPTLSAPMHILAAGIEGGVPAFAVEKTKRVFDAHMESLRQAIRAGITIGSGSDAGTPFNRHGRNAEEIQFLIQAGLSAPLALIAATSAAAAILGVGHETGTIAAGKKADLIAVAGDPVTNPKILLNPEMLRLIIQNGNIVKA